MSKREDRAMSEYSTTRPVESTAPGLLAGFHEICCISGFALFPPRRKFNQSWPLVWTNDSIPASFSSYWKWPRYISNSPFCLLMGNTWPKSADIPTWWSYFYIKALKLKHYLKDNTWGSGSGWCFSSFLKTCFSPLRFTGKHIVRSETP